MSVKEFLNWDSGDALKYELVDGEPRAMVPATRIHGILQGRLATLINNHPDRENRQCSLVVEPGVSRVCCPITMCACRIWR
jgi:Uma2 family endonuclease